MALGWLGDRPRWWDACLRIINYTRDGGEAGVGQSRPLFGRLWGCPLKSFRARLGKHLHAIGFVCIEDDDAKPETESAFPHLKLPGRLDNGWARSTVDADGKDVSLDPHTLKAKFTGPDLALQLDPLEYL